MRIIAGLIALVLMTVAGVAGAAGPVSPSPLQQQVEAALQKSYKDVHVTHMEASPMPGWLEVTLNGTEQVYVSEDGKYMVTGQILQLGPDGVANLSEARMNKMRAAELKKLNPNDLITFPAKGKQKGEIFVFTDVDCPYCRKLHSHIAQINKLGITVHYLAFPRMGLNSPAAATMQAVWCAADRRAALTNVKLHGGMHQKPRRCNDPVAMEYHLGEKFGLDGTPGIYRPDGVQIGGYLPPAELVHALGLKLPQGN